jgi:nucleotide-binding universal stress UspA family protein
MMACVAMASDDQPRSPRSLRLVVAFDDSPAGWGGLRHAAELARTWGGSLTILHSVQPALSTFELGARVLPKYQRAREEAAVLLARAQASLGLDVVSTTELLAGEPGPMVARRAAELAADVLVIGVQRRGTLDRLLFGSVSEAIVLNAAGPVLIVPVEPRS